MEEKLKRAASCGWTRNSWAGRNFSASVRYAVAREALTLIEHTQPLLVDVFYSLSLEGVDVFEVVRHLSHFVAEGIS